MSHFLTRPAHPTLALKSLHMGGILTTKGWSQLEIHSALGERLLQHLPQVPLQSASVVDEHQRPLRETPLSALDALLAMAEREGLHALVALRFEAAHVLEEIPYEGPLASFLVAEMAPVEDSTLDAQLASAPQMPPLQLTHSTDSRFVEGFRKASAHFACGDIFELVLSRRWTFQAEGGPEAAAKALARSTFTQSGRYRFSLPFPDATLVGASPELLVGLLGQKVVCHPISGSIPRTESHGKAPLTQNEHLALAGLLSSEKEKSELDMLVDLARHDLNRIADEVTVTKHREVMILDTLAHTWSEVTGQVRDGLRPLDVVRSCLNAGTLVGAPKRKAMEILARLEGQPRGFYGGTLVHRSPEGETTAILLIRTAVFDEDGIHVQAGATLLSESDLAFEFNECGAKARGVLMGLGKGALVPVHNIPPVGAGLGAPNPLPLKPLNRTQPGQGLRLLLVDNCDSFTFNLEALFRSLGADVRVHRNTQIPPSAGFHGAVLSPGPSSPREAGDLIPFVRAHAGLFPLFGVCLGLQAVVEGLGGSLRTMEKPLHGKLRPVELVPEASRILKQIPNDFPAARYHSLAADTIPSSLRVIAHDGQGLPLAVEGHSGAPLLAVQFHPESHLTGDVGRDIAACWLEAVKHFHSLAQRKQA